MKSMFSYYLLPFVFFASLVGLGMHKINVLDENHQEQKTMKNLQKSHLLYEETFEGPKPFSTAFDPTDHIGTNYGVQLVNNPVFEGHGAARFEIREDQPLVKKGKRAEIVIVKGTQIKPETWYSFAVYCPSKGYEYDTEREVISQWYQGGTPATSIRTQKDRFLIESGNEKGELKRYDLGPIAKDSWHQFVLHFIHSYGSDGLIEVWKDGNKLITLKGGNMYNEQLPKWKIGLYKAAFKHGTSLISKRVIYFDNIRVGEAKATYDDMVGGKKI